MTRKDIEIVPVKAHDNRQIYQCENNFRPFDFYFSLEPVKWIDYSCQLKTIWHLQCKSQIIKFGSYTQIQDYSKYTTYLEYRGKGTQAVCEEATKEIKTE